MEVDFIPEPDLEFGYSGRHQEQRAGLMLHGPADIEFPSRPAQMAIGMVGRRKDLDELQAWLERCANGVPARTDTKLETLFPAFPGLTGDSTFRSELVFRAEGRSELDRAQLRAIEDAGTEAATIAAATTTVSSAITALLDRAAVDVVLIARPPKVPDGTAATRGQIGLNFHDVLKASVISARVPIQIVRPRTWRGGVGVEDEASRAWNLMTALYYKCGGKPWRLPRDRHERTRCFVGVSFTRSDSGAELHTSVAQVFNELGDGVIVRGALARRSQQDRQPHLSRDDATGLLTQALARYRSVHGATPADVALHKTSAFSDDERDGFLRAADDAQLHSVDLVWVTDSEDAFLIRGSSEYPPLRGTLLTLDDDHYALYTHGSVPYYKTYPGMYVPRPLGIRPCDTARGIDDIAAEILALSKLNWNRARLDARRPITLLTARRVGEILRHVPLDTEPAAHYSYYM